MNFPLLCLDFDGVIHGYQSGWKGADTIPDPPVPGALDFIRAANARFRVAIYSSRSNQPSGIEAMQAWLRTHLVEAFGPVQGLTVLEQIEWPTYKPPAFVTIDDRALTFRGEFPDLDDLAAFKTWMQP